MKIAVIGGGIVGSVAAFYLTQNQQYTVTLYDDGHGQATKASAGIICPWFSKRRNKAWYRLANAGAHFYPQLMKDLQKAGTTSKAYQARPTWLLKRRPQLIDDLIALATQRKANAPLIGKIKKLSPTQQTAILSEWHYPHDIIAIESGAAVIDGEMLCQDLLRASFSNGLIYHPTKAVIDKISAQSITVQGESFDRVLLAAGAWLGDLLTPHHFKVDVHPQKGQLAVYRTTTSHSWPLIMPEGETDIIPHQNNLLYLGATHENDQDFDQHVQPEALSEIFNTMSHLFPHFLLNNYVEIKVGTRAYTRDFSPFYGPVPKFPHLFVASGLGSSGLTTGPLIGHELAHLITQNTLSMDWADYDPKNYIQKILE